jgi:hypothetical protein
MNPLEELLLKWRDGFITETEIAELNANLATPEGRARLREEFDFDVALHDAFLAEKAAEKSQAQAEKFFDAKIAQSKSRRGRVLWWLPWVASAPARSRTWAWGFAAVAAATVVAALWFWFWPHPQIRTRGAQFAQASTGTVVQRNGRTLPFTAAMELRPGDLVKTPGSGFAVLSFPSEATHFELGGDAALVWAKGPSQDRWELRQGELQCIVARHQRHQPLEIFTPLARVTIIGTKFALWTRRGETRLDVEQGLVTIQRLRDGQTVEVSSDYYAIVESAGPLEAQFGANVNLHTENLPPGQTVLDDTAPEISYSPGWQIRFNGRFRNSTHETCKPGEWAELTFVGTEVSLTGEKMPYGGTADLYLDGRFHSTLSYHAPYPGLTRRIIFSISGLPRTAHTIKLVGHDDGWIYVDSIRYRP